MRLHKSDPFAAEEVKLTIRRRASRGYSVQFSLCLVAHGVVVGHPWVGRDIRGDDRED